MPRAKRKAPYDPNKVHDRRAADSNKGVKNHLVPKEVDDPYEIGGKIVTLQSLRDDPLASLHAHHHIDQAQYEGGRAFQQDFETAERGPRAIDPSKEAVDGGQMPEPITEAQRKATMRLAQVHRKLGQNGSALIHAVLIEHKSIDMICADRRIHSQRENDYVGRRFRECLDCLAVFYDLAMEKRR